MKRWLVRAALALGATLLALLLAEGALALLSIGEPILRAPDPVFGAAPIPSAEGWWTREGRAYVRITEHGFRGVDHPHEKPRGVLRVAILGDSYTEANQVALDAAFPAHLERALNACLAQPVEVLSFGVSGYGTAQERLVLERRVWSYAPDLVLLAFLTGNDVADNHPGLRASGDPAPYYRLRDGELVLDDSFARSPELRQRMEPSPWRWLRRRSRLARVLSRVGSSRAEGGLSEEVYREPADREWRDAWAWTEAILTQMHRDVSARDARFVVATLSNAQQVHPDPRARERYARSLGVDDLLYPDRRIAALGAREGFEVLTLAAPLAAYAERHGVHLHGFPNTAMSTGHWNERGHRVAGARMGAWLCRELGAVRPD